MTIKDIAREVGVSHTAVSMALRGAEGVSEKTRQQILAQAAAMNYQPRIAARLLRSQQTGQIGLIMSGTPTMESSAGIFMPVFSAFVARCEREGISYHIEYVRNDEDGPGQLPQQLVGRLVDGALTIGYLGRELREMVSQYPWVSVEEPAPYAVLSDTRLGVVEAVRSLMALGHRRIGYAGGPVHYNTHRVALDGYQEAVDRFDLPPLPPDWPTTLRMADPTAIEECVAWAHAVLDSPFGATAYVCNDIRMARALVYVAMERGLRVPEDLSVIGGGMSRDAIIAWPLLSTIECDFDGMIEHALHLLRERIAGRDPGETTKLVRPYVRHRRSTGPVPDARP